MVQADCHGEFCKNPKTESQFAVYIELNSAEERQRRRLQLAVRRPVAHIDGLQTAAFIKLAILSNMQKED